MFSLFFILGFILMIIRWRSNSSMNRSSSLWHLNLDYDPYSRVASREVTSKQASWLLFIIIPLIIYPPLGVIMIPVGVVIWALLSRLRKENVNKAEKERRHQALRRASYFLAPYKDIWRNLKLSNNYCSLKLGMDGVTITAIEKLKDPNLPYRTFKVTESRVFNEIELWNLFCLNFTYNKSFDGLLEDCNTFRASIYQDIVVPKVQDSSLPKLVEKVDINNSSEAELTALPGVSIVISKKLIKKREEIGGFKSVEEVLMFLKLKPNITEQLRQRICVNKMKGSLIVKRNQERTVDL